MFTTIQGSYTPILTKVLEFQIGYVTFCFTKKLFYKMQQFSIYTKTYQNKEDPFRQFPQHKP